MENLVTRSCVVCLNAPVPGVVLNQTVPDRAELNLFCTTGPLRPVIYSCPARLRQPDRSEQARCPANKADSRPATDDDSLLSTSSVLLSFRAANGRYFP